MLISNRRLLDNLTSDLGALIEARKMELFSLNREISHDTDYWISEDYETVKLYLKNYTKNHYSANQARRIKAKGKILIILSYNEPFILSIIPILNALVVGNEVILKPSKEAEGFAKIVWQESGLLDKYGLKMQIFCPNIHEEIMDLVQNVRAVYFFGSYKVAQSLARKCGERYVEFYPEIETSDVKIFHKKSSAINSDPTLTLRESFSHSGQSCQRVQGIFVHKDTYSSYLLALKKEFVVLSRSSELSNFIDSRFTVEREKSLDLLRSDIERSQPIETLEINSLPILVINPKANSEFANNAYFLPVLWISPFDRTEDLIDSLNSRKFFLGINIQSDDNNFIDRVISKTRFTRYTVNTSHSNIRPEEGWGGSSPSGFSGYKSWIEHFSDGYTIITK